MYVSGTGFLSKISTHGFSLYLYTVFTPEPINLLAIKNLRTLRIIGRFHHNEPLQPLHWLASTFERATSSQKLESLTIILHSLLSTDHVVHVLLTFYIWGRLDHILSVGNFPYLRQVNIWHRRHGAGSEEIWEDISSSLIRALPLLHKAGKA